MDWTAQRESFRAILAGTRCVQPASVFDPISARIAEMLGYEAGMFAGSLAALAVLGAPERTPSGQNLDIMTLSELAEQAYRICRASTLPLMIDADAGYGNALNVMRTVEELETAGVAVVMVEDSVLPTGYGQTANELVSTAEAVAKLRAALHARGDARLVIAGRSAVANNFSLKEIAERARAYSSTGVDALWFSSITTREQIETLAGAVEVPLLLAPKMKKGGPEAVFDLEYLAAHGVRACIQGHQPIRAAIQAVYVTLKALRDGVPPGELTGLAPEELMQRLSHADGYEEQTRQFLGA